MAQEEIFGKRVSAYSAWHRRKSTARFVGMEHAQRLAMVDIDVTLWLEYDDNTKMPLAIVETAIDKGQSYKYTTPIFHLAKLAGIPAYLVFYKLADAKNPASPNDQDIEAFRVKRLIPQPDLEFRTYKPEEWAKGLLKLREWCAKRDNLIWQA